jgi:hypothetical protein
MPPDPPPDHHRPALSDCPAMAQKRATKVEKEKRIAQLVRLISNGAVTSELVHFGSTEWQVTPRQAHDYIAEARKVIVADINRDRSVVVAEMMHTCQTIIKKGMQGGNYNAVLGAMNRIAALGGLDQAK